MTNSPTAMRQNEITSEEFAQLLKWLAPDLERAGEKYEQIRRSLIKIFGLSWEYNSGRTGGRDH